MWEGKSIMGRILSYQLGIENPIHMRGSGLRWELHRGPWWWKIKGKTQSANLSKNILGNVNFWFDGLARLINKIKGYIFIGVYNIMFLSLLIPPLMPILLVFSLWVRIKLSSLVCNYCKPVWEFDTWKDLIHPKHRQLFPSSYQGSRRMQSSACKTSAEERQPGS